MGRPARGARRRRSPASRHNQAEPLVVSLLTLVAVAFIAFNEGGLDLVFRQQLAIGVLWGSSLAFLFGVLPRARLTPAAKRVLVGFGLLAGWTALSLLWAPSVEKAMADLSRVLLYGGIVSLIFVGMSRVTWRAPAIAICAATLLLPVLSLVSFVTPGTLFMDPLASFERLSYPLGYWNALAAWCAMAITVGLALSVRLRDPAMRGVALALLPAAALCLYLTLSRGGIVAAAVGVLAIAVASGRPLSLALHSGVVLAAAAGLILFVRAHPGLDSDFSAGVELLSLTVLAGAACFVVAARSRTWAQARAGRRLAIGWVVAVLAVGAFMAFVLGSWRDGPDDSSPETLSAAYPARESDTAARLTSLGGSRTAVWSSALRAWETAPLLGIGPGSFEFWWVEDVVGGEELREPHSLYLGYLAELGVPGLVAILAVVASLLAGALRVARAECRSSPAALSLALSCSFGVFLVHAAVDWLWESTATAILALAGAAVVVASLSEPRSAGLRTRPGRAGIGAALAALVCGVAIVPGTVSAERVRASLAALATGQVDEAEEVASSGIAAEPWAARAYAARALARLAQSDLLGARADAQEAIERERTNWRHYLLLAGIEASDGDETAAAASLAVARALNPGLDAPLESLAGDLPQAGGP